MELLYKKDDCTFMADGKTLRIFLGTKGSTRINKLTIPKTYRKDTTAWYHLSHSHKDFTFDEVEIYNEKSWLHDLHVAAQDHHNASKVNVQNITIDTLEVKGQFESITIRNDITKAKNIIDHAYNNFCIIHDDKGISNFTLSGFKNTNPNMQAPSKNDKKKKRSSLILGEGEKLLIDNVKADIIIVGLDQEEIMSPNISIENSKINDLSCNQNIVSVKNSTANSIVLIDSSGDFENITAKGLKSERSYVTLKKSSSLTVINSINDDSYKVEKSSFTKFTSRNTEVVSFNECIIKGQLDIKDSKELLIYYSDIAGKTFVEKTPKFISHTNQFREKISVLDCAEVGLTQSIFHKRFDAEGNTTNIVTWYGTARKANIFNEAISLSGYAHLRVPDLEYFRFEKNIFLHSKASAHITDRYFNANETGINIISKSDIYKR